MGDILQNALIERYVNSLGLMTEQDVGSATFVEWRKLIDTLFDQALNLNTPKPITTCTDCGACRQACPAGLDIGGCLSALTQKKGALTADEEKIILANGTAWGCDRCQEICPVNRAARARGTLYSTIRYFNESALPCLTAQTVEEMSEADFARRAYSWRGRAVILRNLQLLETRTHPTEESGKEQE